MVLVITHRPVHETTVAGDVVQRLFGTDAPAWLADNHGQFAFIIEVVTFPGFEQGLAMA